ncbi:MAG: hypothetical protein AVDCRST_MAG54-1978, partial [uncultured Actinomycetospora sp.]
DRARVRRLAHAHRGHRPAGRRGRGRRGRPARARRRGALESHRGPRE